MESGWEEAVVNLTKEETQKNSNLRIKMVKTIRNERKWEREVERREEMERKRGGKGERKLRRRLKKSSIKNRIKNRKNG